MKKTAIIYVLIVAMVAVAGCGSKTPNIGIETSWRGLAGWLPVIGNDMGTKDSKVLEVIVENQDKSILKDVILRVSSNIPNMKISPTYATVMALGPEGTSKTNPSTFTLETLDAPPGKYSFWVFAEYDGQTIKSEKVDIDIG